jgi:hypothetical protein
MHSPYGNVLVEKKRRQNKEKKLSTKVDKSPAESATKRPKEYAKESFISRAVNIIGKEEKK